MAEKKKQYKFPKLLGACADRLYKLVEDRRLAQRKADELEAEEKALKEYIINTLPKSQASGVAGKLARVSIDQKDVPSPKDWDKIYKYILKTKSFELLQRRLASQVVQERWEAGKEVPGVERFKVTTVSLTKL